MLSTSLVVLLLLIDHGSVAKQTLSSPNSGSFEENLPGNPLKDDFDASSNSSGQSMLGYGIEDITSPSETPPSGWVTWQWGPSTRASGLIPCKFLYCSRWLSQKQISTKTLCIALGPCLQVLPNLGQAKQTGQGGEQEAAGDSGRGDQEGECRPASPQCLAGRPRLPEPR